MAQGRSHQALPVLNPLGVVPWRRLNAVARCCGWLKPQSNAISVTDRRVVVKRVAARSRRILSIALLGVDPVAARNLRQNCRGLRLTKPASSVRETSSATRSRIRSSTLFNTAEPKPKPPVVVARRWSSPQAWAAQLSTIRRDTASVCTSSCRRRATARD